MHERVGEVRGAHRRVARERARVEVRAERHPGRHARQEERHALQDSRRRVRHLQGRPRERAGAHRVGVAQQVEEREQPAHAVPEEEPRHAGPPLLRQVRERAQVGDELAKVAAVSARPPRAAVAAVVDGRDAEPARGEVRDEVAVAANVLRVAVREEDDTARGTGRRRRALPVDGDTADAGEGALGRHGVPSRDSVG